MKFAFFMVCNFNLKMRQIASFSDPFGQKYFGRYLKHTEIFDQFKGAVFLLDISINLNEKIGLEKNGKIAFIILSN